VISVIYVLLAAVAAIAIDLRLVLIPAACVSISLAGAGIVVFRRWAGALSIPWPAIANEEEQQGVVVIDGTSLPFQGYDQELIVMMRPRHLVELLACVLLAASALYVMIFVLVVGRVSEALEIGAFETELICIAGLIVLLTSVRWFAERRFLARSHYTIGTLIGADPGFLWRGVTYQVFDEKRERRGGRGPFLGRDPGNAVLVFYDPNNPDVNATHGAFFFHSFRMGLIPARHRSAGSVAPP